MSNCSRSLLNVNQDLPDRFEELHDELLINIYSRLEFKDLVNCRCLNKRSAAIIDETLSLNSEFSQRFTSSRQGNLSLYTAIRYDSEIRDWLQHFKENDTRWLDTIKDSAHFPEALFFSKARTFSKARGYSCHLKTTFKQQDCLEHALISPDVRYIVTASSDSTVKINCLDDNKQWQEKASTQAKFKRITRIRLSPDSSHLLIESRKSVMTSMKCLWRQDDETWQEKGSFEYETSLPMIHNNNIIICDVSSNGRFLLKSSGREVQLKILEDDGSWRTHKYFFNFLDNPNYTTSPFSYFPLCTFFSPDSRHCAISTMSYIEILTCDDNDQWIDNNVFFLDGLTMSVHFSLSHRHLAVVSDQNTVKLLRRDDKGTWQEKTTVKFLDKSYLSSKHVPEQRKHRVIYVGALNNIYNVKTVRFSTDDQHLAIASSENFGKSLTFLRFNNDGQWEENQTIEHQHPGIILDTHFINFSADCKFILAPFPGEHTVKALYRDNNNGQWRESFSIGTHDDLVKDAFFSPDGLYIITASCNRHSFNIWEIQEKTEDRVISCHEESSESLCSP